MFGGFSGKLNFATRPRKQKRAASKARAAFSAESYDPNQILSRLFGSLISDTHLPHFLFLTPLNFESLLSATGFSTLCFTIYGFSLYACSDLFSS
jgi:hypothetical protein